MLGVTEDTERERRGFGLRTAEGYGIKLIIFNDLDTKSNIDSKALTFYASIVL